MRISAIAVVTDNLAMGKDNGLLFHVPGDLPRFKRITMGHPVIMGRKTFESKEINKRLLPGRLNIVITRDTSYDGNGAVVVGSLEEAVEKAKEAPGSDEVFILGGAQIFKEALPKVQRLYLTVVHKNTAGDVYFPDYATFTKVIENTPMQTEDLSFSFLTLDR